MLYCFLVNREGEIDIRSSRVISAVAVMLCGLWATAQVIAAKAVEGSQFAGVWAGAWQGGGSGKFDITLAVSPDGALGGSVSVGTDAGDYNAKFKSLVFDGNKMTATYDYPLDTQGEIALAGTFTATDASGTWSLGPQGQATTNSMANGSFAVKKK